MDVSQRTGATADMLEGQEVAWLLEGQVERLADALGQPGYWLPDPSSQWLPDAILERRSGWGSVRRQVQTWAWMRSDALLVLWCLDQCARLRMTWGEDGYQPDQVRGQWEALDWTFPDPFLGLVGRSPWLDETSARYGVERAASGRVVGWEPWQLVDALQGRELGGHAHLDDPAWLEAALGRRLTEAHGQREHQMRFWASANPTLGLLSDPDDEDDTVLVLTTPTLDALGHLDMAWVQRAWRHHLGHTLRRWAAAHAPAAHAPVAERPVMSVRPQRFAPPRFLPPAAPRSDR